MDRLSPALSATQIMKKREEERQMFKESMVKEEKSFRMLKQQEKKARTSKWKKKTLVSPFRVDLVAEVEKMDEVFILLIDFEFIIVNY